MVIDIEMTEAMKYYREKSVFITGGSGFIGKVLIEKLLRSCPDIKKIYLLLREKKGKTVEERIKEITDLPLFDLLRSQQPFFLSKLYIITGDVKELNLGLRPSDRQLLINEVNIIFHGAASVRFDDSLTDAILLNTRGTREVAKLALDIKNLEVLVHISTTYCHCDQKVIEEKLYPPFADWRKTIEIAEKIDRNTLDVLTEKYIHPLPNTYTFTKALAEHVVNDLCRAKIPTVIFRPSIIISTAFEPVVGWIDNFNGPVGLLLGCGKGIVQIVYADPTITSDYVPVDIAVRAIINTSWKQHLIKDKSQKLIPNVYNGSNNNIHNVTMTDVVKIGNEICKEVPMEDVLWYPGGYITKCYYYYLIKVLFAHFLPALIIDGLLKLLGKKPLLVKIQRRVFVANMALSYFTQNQWKFINDKCMKLQQELLPSDFESFSYKENDLGTYEFFKNATIGAKKFLLKEDVNNLERAKKHCYRMKIIAQVANVLWYLGLIWIVFFKIDIISVFMKIINNVVLYLTED